MAMTSFGLDCNGEFVPFSSGAYSSQIAFCFNDDSGFADGILRYRNLEIDSSHFFRIIGVVS